jgi:hypothetical protein
MWTLFLLTAVIIGLAILGLGINVFFSKKKGFPNTHVKGNENLKKLGITCASDKNGKCSCTQKGKKTEICQ